MIIAVVLLLIGVAAIILEFFVPAFGLVGILGGTSIVISIIKAFKYSTVAGAIFLTSSLIIVPVLLILFFKVFPNTFIGKKLILNRSLDREAGFESTAVDYESIQSMTGTSLTDLRPAGTIVVDGKKYSAVTSGEYIEKNKKIRVLKTEGSKITVAEVS